MASSAETTYKELVEKAESLLPAIGRLLEQHVPEGVPSWQHVGDVEHVLARLTEVVDFLTH